MTYISAKLLDGYLEDGCFVSIAGLIRSAYTEGAGEGFLSQIKAAVKRKAIELNPERLKEWELFLTNTVPLLIEDAKKWTEMQNRFQAPKQPKKKPVPRRRG